MKLYRMIININLHLKQNKVVVVDAKSYDFMSSVARKKCKQNNEALRQHCQTNFLKFCKKLCKFSNKMRIILFNKYIAN